MAASRKSSTTYGTPDGTELVGHTPAHAAVAADDEVAAQPLDRPLPSSFRQHAGQHAAGDRLDDNGAGVRDDRQPASTIAIESARAPSDGGTVSRPGERRGDDRAVERLEPRLVEDEAEADRAAADRRRDGHESDSIWRRRRRASTPLVCPAWTTTRLRAGTAGERRLNIHLDPTDIAGGYANFANISFSRYEFTLTFARIEHEVEEGDVPGAVRRAHQRRTALSSRMLSRGASGLGHMVESGDGRASRGSVDAEPAWDARRPGTDPGTLDVLFGASRRARRGRLRHPREPPRARSRARRDRCRRRRRDLVPRRHRRLRPAPERVLRARAQRGRRSASAATTTSRCAARSTWPSSAATPEPRPPGRASVLDAERARASSHRCGPRARRDGVALFHGSARDPVWEYVLSDESISAALARPTDAGRARRPQPCRARGLARRRRAQGRPRAGRHRGRPRGHAGAAQSRLGRPAARRRSARRLSRCSTSRPRARVPAGRLRHRRRRRPRCARSACRPRSPSALSLGQ